MQCSAPLSSLKSLSYTGSCVFGLLHCSVLRVCGRVCGSLSISVPICLWLLSQCLSRFLCRFLCLSLCLRCICMDWHGYKVKYTSLCLHACVYFQYTHKCHNIHTHTLLGHVPVPLLTTRITLRTHMSQVKTSSRNSASQVPAPSSLGYFSANDAIFLNKSVRSCIINVGIE